MAYVIIHRLKSREATDTLSMIEKAVTASDRENGRRHEIWKESFDWKYCKTPAFAYQKLLYIHNNPSSGKWGLSDDITKYEHSSARYNINGKHARYTVKEIEETLV